ncbi:MAG: hypothetical protein AAGC99_17500 [Pseudomonadota bacterium]
MAAGVLLERRSKIGQLEVEIATAHGYDLEQGQIITTLGNTGRGKPKHMAIVANAIGRQIATIDKPFQPSVAHWISNAEPCGSLLYSCESVAVHPLERARIAWCEIHESPLRFVCSVS